MIGAKLVLGLRPPPYSIKYPLIVFGGVHIEKTNTGIQGRLTPLFNLITV